MIEADGLGRPILAEAIFGSQVSWRAIHRGKPGQVTASFLKDVAHILVTA